MAGLARGKIIYGDASGDPAALAAGSNGQVLKMDGSGDIVWGTDSGGAALTGSTNNTVTTVTGSDAIAGEANLLFETVNSTAPVLSIGVAPDVAAKDWKSTQSALQIGGALTLSTTSDPDADGDNLVVISNNTYYDHADDRWNHIATDDKGMQLRMYDGKFEFRTSGNKRNTGDEFTDGAVFSVNESGNIVNSGTLTVGSTLISTHAYANGFSGGDTVRDTQTRDDGQMGYWGSSERYKTNINSMENINWLFDLRPVDFDWKKDNSSGYGLIAEEVADVNEYLITRNEDGQPETVEYSRLTPFLLKAVQELSAKVEALENA
jgi:hypothetical protein